MRLLLVIASSLCLCIGLWNHDWTVIIASCLLAFAWMCIGEEVQRRELDRLWDDDDLSGSA